MLRATYPCCGQPARLNPDDRVYDRRCNRCGRGWRITRSLLASTDAGDARVDRLDGYVGLIERHRSRDSGHVVSVYAAEPSGIADGSEGGYALVCEEHSTLIAVDTLRMARWHGAAPLGWCEECAGLESSP